MTGFINQYRIFFYRRFPLENFLDRSVERDRFYVLDTGYFKRIQENDEYYSSKRERWNGENHVRR